MRQSSWDSSHARVCDDYVANSGILSAREVRDQTTESKGEPDTNVASYSIPVSSPVGVKVATVSLPEMNFNMSMRDLKGCDSFRLTKRQRTTPMHPPATPRKAKPQKRKRPPTQVETSLM